MREPLCHCCEQDSVAVLTTNPFVPQHPVFVMEQLSEVGEEGIALDLWVLDEDGELLEERELPVHTGGYVPALMPFHDPIEAFPEIDTESAQLGEFTRSLVDVEDYADQTIQLQFRQHTRIEGNGFFTLLDNLCDGEPTDLD